MKSGIYLSRERHQTSLLAILEHSWPIYLAIAGMSLGNLWIWSRPEALPQTS